ncbi:hypothetical protein ACFQ1R_14600 [Mariniflexile jejuense]|uniref:Uncharacterized protein n=1 Tax=Mariniflexile jejuense TaxID=1173582 RepID=A0ABW3JN13_9FLAO
MDLTKIKNLTDEQLISLFRNPTITEEIKKRVLEEIKLRELKELKSVVSKDEIEFSKKEILKLIFLPFSYRLHRKNLFEKSWSVKRDKQFWNYITLGIALYTILLFIVLFLKNNI